MAVDRYLLVVEALPAESQRLLACDVAEWALEHSGSLGLEPDERSWQAVETARAFARSEVTENDLRTAYEAAHNAWMTAKFETPLLYKSCAEDPARTAAAPGSTWAAAEYAARGAARFAEQSVRFSARTLDLPALVKAESAAHHSAYERFTLWAVEYATGERL